MPKVLSIVELPLLVAPPFLPYQLPLTQQSSINAKFPFQLSTVFLFSAFLL